MTPISIKFPMTKEATGNRRGPRFRRVPDKARLSGAASCAAGMVAIAIRKRDLAATIPGYRDQARLDLSRQIDRACMRTSALWARVFAGQIDQHDPRLAAAQAHHSALVQTYCTPAAA
jgi:hypothetical protein